MKRRKFISNAACIGALSVVRPMGLFGHSMTASGNYVIQQFEDKGLAQFSYAVMANKKIIIIDPKRDPQVYYDFAGGHGANIVGVIETHPHADFASAHLEIHEKLNVPIYSSSLTNPEYPGTAFDDGQIIELSSTVGLRSCYTPGHAPDHISVVLFEGLKDRAVFSGDSLLIGDVGRPDLRDFSNNVEAQRQKLAGMMYDTVHEKFGKMNDDVTLYPAHGAGSLCSKSTRQALSSTIGYEREHNHAFENITKSEFVERLLSDQPFIPKYFSYAVGLNIQGAPVLANSIEHINREPRNFSPGTSSMIIDSRPAETFKKSYIPNAINIQNGGSFATWLGSLVAPEKKFYLVAANREELEEVISRAASIGYETKLEGAFIYDATDGESFSVFKKDYFEPEENKYTFIDVRTSNEVKAGHIFENSINIPLQELDQRASEIPTDKPILVNCASGYRSAAASSLIKKLLPDAQIYDLGSAVKDYH